MAAAMTPITSQLKSIWEKQAESERALTEQAKRKSDLLAPQPSASASASVDTTNALRQQFIDMIGSTNQAALATQEKHQQMMERQYHHQQAILIQNVFSQRKAVEEFMTEKHRQGLLVDSNRQLQQQQHQLMLNEFLATRNDIVSEANRVPDLVYQAFISQQSQLDQYPRLICRLVEIAEMAEHRIIKKVSRNSSLRCPVN